MNWRQNISQRQADEINYNGSTRHAEKENPINIELIFALQFFMNLVVIGLLLKWLLVPWLAQQSHQQSLFWLLLPHAF